MRLIYVLILCLHLLQASEGSDAYDESNESCHTSQQMEEQCGMYAHRIIKPMMAYFDQVTQKIDKNEAEIENKNNKIRQLEEKVKEMGRKNERIHNLEKEVASCTAKERIIMLLEDNIKNLKQEIQTLTKLFELQSAISCEKQNNLIAELSAKIKSGTENAMKCETKLKSKETVIAKISKDFAMKCKTELESKETVIAKHIEKVRQLETEAKISKDFAMKCETELESKETVIAKHIEKVRQLATEAKISKEQQERYKLELDQELKKKSDIMSKEIKKKNKMSCISRNTTGVHQVTIDNDLTFEVLCNTDIAGPGWTIIQQRINGRVDFYRNWEEYMNGFGEFWDGDFFLGLEKIHRLTSEIPHELYIHMERYNCETSFARYDEFTISGEDNQYRLSTLGAFSGSKYIVDHLSYHYNMKFSTYDRDNDMSDRIHCAKYNHNGWWSRSCQKPNLNGKYFEYEVKGKLESMHWNGFINLKKVMMMIRPKSGGK